jgi:hypothetical protein
MEGRRQVVQLGLWLAVLEGMLGCMELRACGCRRGSAGTRSPGR